MQKLCAFGGLHCCLEKIVKNLLDFSLKPLHLARNLHTHMNLNSRPQN